MIVTHVAVCTNTDTELHTVSLQPSKLGGFRISDEFFWMNDYMMKKLELCFRKGTFVWLILFVQPGTEDKALCLQCNVRSFVLRLTNISPLQPYVGVL